MALIIKIYDDERLIKKIDGNEYQEKYEILDDLEGWIIDMRKFGGYDSE